MVTKKYVTVSKLSVFLGNLRNTFAALSHTHTMSDVLDYAVDDALSSTSTNPVQNKVLDAEFDAISESFAALEAVVDAKQDAIPIYDGVFEITPSATGETVLLTSGTAMDANVVVKKIPYVETENAAGGTTVTIG